MEGLIGLVVLLVLSVPVLLVVALAWISGLRARVTRLEAEVNALRHWQAEAAEREPTLAERARDAASPRLQPGAVAQPFEPAETPPPRPMRVSDPATAMSSARPMPDATPPVLSSATFEVSSPTPSIETTQSAEEASPIVAPTSALDASPPPKPIIGTRATFVIDDPASPSATRTSSATATPPPLPPRPRVQPPQDSAFVRVVRGWFTEGNVPVKVGVLVLFAGLAALMKYAADAGWLRVPMELRLAGIALAALGALVFAFGKRESNRTFALTLQGGAIGVLLLLVFAAFKLYGLIPAGAAFALSVALVAGTGVLAVKQDALALAVFGLLAGFLAPLWLSTGSGNHVALFGYYAVLNAGLFAIAWWRAWRVLNLLGFAFTFGIGALWGASAYTPLHYDTTQPFLALFFAMYLLIPLLYARRSAGARHDAIDGTLVFGTPLVAFSLQAALLDGAQLPLAFCALGIAALYAALAAGVRRSASMQALLMPYAMLAIAFATLAVPLALSAQATACVLAVEGAALCWLGLRQDRRLPQLAGLLLQAAAALSFLEAMLLPQTGGMAVLNAHFAAAALIAVSGVASAYWYRQAEQRGVALALYLWAMTWWLLATLSDVGRYVQPDLRAAVGGVVVLVTGALATEAYVRLQASRALAWTFTISMLSGVPLALWLTAESGHPFAHLGWMVWVVFVAIGLRGLHLLRDVEDAPVGLAHASWWVSLTLVVSLLLQWAAEQGGFGSGWQLAGVALPWLALLAAIDSATRLVATPIGARFDDSRTALKGLVVALVAFGGFLALFDRGDASPAAWIALLNPLDLVQVLALTLLARIALTGDAAARASRLPWLAAAAFALVTAITLRATHHWGGVAWSADMGDSSLVQTSLSIVWSVLGVIGWVVGSRRHQRGVWTAGAVLMAVVLVKLVLVDRGHLGNLLGIASFIAYGLLCVAVGYFAPAPPRRIEPDPEPV